MSASFKDTHGGRMMWKNGMKTLILLILGTLLWIHPLGAESAPRARRFDLYGCIRQAITTNPQMQVAKFDVDRAELQLKSAKLSRIGKIELFNRTGIVEDAVGDAITGEKLSGSYDVFNRLNILFSLPLYTFGRVSRGIDAAGENVNRQLASQFKTGSDLILGVHKRYYGYVLAHQLLNTTEQIQKNFSEAYEVAEERLDMGDALVTETDALKLRVGLAVVTKNLYTVQREVRVAKEALREIMGLDDSVDFQVADNKLKEVDFNLRQLDQYLQQAKKNNPDIKQLKAAVSAEEARYLAEKGKYYPTLLAVGGLRHAVAPGREDQDNPFLKDDYNYFDAGASLGVKWDLNFFQTDTGVKEHKVRYLRMKSLLERALDAVALQVKEKYHQYTEKKNSLDASFEAKKAGRALLFLNLTNFKLGMGSGKDVFDSLSLHARVDGEYYEAIFKYNMAVVELQDVIGMLKPEKFKAS